MAVDSVLTAVDSSVVIAGLLGLHSHHARASAALATLLEHRDLVLPSRVLAESYSVMTRLPAPLRLSPEDGLDLLTSSFEHTSTIITHGKDDPWRCLHDSASREIGGGAFYDAEIALMVAKAGVSRLLTFNRRDFERVAPEGLEIVEP